MRNEVLSYDDLLQIVQLIKSAEAFSEFHLKFGDIELELRKDDGAPPLRPAAAHVPAPALAAPIPAPAVQPAAPVPAAAAQAAPVRGAADAPAGSVLIRSPMVGTFYRSPEPGAPPFVEVGQRVQPDTTVCIIEVMKLMNSIPAGCAGKVVQVLLDDAEPVEMAQLLIVIEPERVA